MDKLICEYCGAVQEKVMFCIGASKGPEWTMHEGTGKVSCDDPVCYTKGVTEGQAAINAHVNAHNMRCK